MKTLILTAALLLGSQAHSIVLADCEVSDVGTNQKIQLSLGDKIKVQVENENGQQVLKASVGEDLSYASTTAGDLIQNYDGAKQIIYLMGRGQTKPQLIVSISNDRTQKNLREGVLVLSSPLGDEKVASLICL